MSKETVEEASLKTACGGHACDLPHLTATAMSRAQRWPMESWMHGQPAVSSSCPQFTGCCRWESAAHSFAKMVATWHFHVQQLESLALSPKLPDLLARRRGAAIWRQIGQVLGEKKGGAIRALCTFEPCSYFTVLPRWFSTKSHLC